MKLLLSHIADPDGIAPIILFNLVKENFEYKLFEVNDLDLFIKENINLDYFEQYDQIIITDLGFSKETADLIVNSKYKNKFKLFDHHISRTYLNDYEFAKVVEEENGHKECGTTLFYNYLKEIYNDKILTKNSVKMFVELVRENDTWQFNYYKKESKDLTELFDFYGKDTFIKNYTEFLNNNEEFYFNDTEKLILESLNRKRLEYLESMKDKVIIKNIRGYNVGIVFAENYRSELGNYLSIIYKDEIDFVCIINMARHISLRGIKKDKPVNVFAEMYGGGGHPLASAMQYPKDLKQKIIEYIWSNDENR